LINVKGGFLVDTVPVVQANYNFVLDTVVVTIDQGKLNGKGRLTLAGYFDNDLRHALSGARDEEQKRAQVKSLSSKGNNKYKLNQYKIERGVTNSHYDYSFEIESYLVENGDELYINLNLDKIYESFKELNKDRKLSIEDDFHKVYKFKFRLMLPPHYKLDFMPKNSSFHHDQFGYEVSYSAHPEFIDYELNIRKEFLILDAEHFEAFNQMFKKLK
jgi:hypothetical protein